MGATFQDILNSKTPTLVDFSAEWCGPCQMMAPILKELKNLVKDQAKIVKVDVDRNKELAAKYQVRSVPTLIIFQGGEVKWRTSGVVPAHELEQQLTTWMTDKIVC